MIQCDVTESAILGIWYRGHGTRLKDKKKFGITGFPTAINLSLLLFPCLSLSRERVLFIGTQFSILYTFVYLPA